MLLYVILLSFYGLVLCDRCSYQLNDNYPNIGLSSSDLILNYGYPVQKYAVQTEDGFILDLLRIPHSKNDYTFRNRTPIYLNHGIEGSSDDYLVTGPEFGLPYLLSDEGYDVWLGNNRGNKYSLKHSKYKQTDERFWDFSFNEIGFYDVAAFVDKILNITGQSSLIYVGHSQGTTISFSLLSQKPEYNQKIRLVSCMAPAAFMHNTPCPACRLLAMKPDLPDLLNLLGIKNLRANAFISSVFVQLFCTGDNNSFNICREVLFLLFGKDPEQLDPKLVPVIATIIPSGASVKQVVHYLQLIKSGRFGFYDFGSVTNNLKYGDTTAPSYNLTKITAPVAIYIGPNDAVISETDVIKLNTSLPNVVEYRKINYEFFSHMDFLFARDIRTLLYNHMLELFRQYT